MASDDTKLEQLRSQGRLAMQGEFVLDPEKAREKLSKYQLEDPHFYVLELVQAAHLLGATKIEVEQDADELEMRFDGRALEEEQLEDIFSFAFQRSKSPDLLALRHLAIALQCAQALGPKHLWFERVDKDQAVRLIVDERQAQLQEFTPELEIKRAHYRFYLRERFRFGHLLEFFEARNGVQAERRVIAERCEHSRVEILLNGHAITRGELWSSKQPELLVDEELIKAVLYPIESGQSAQLVLVRNGVRFETMALPSGPVTGELFSIVVDAGDLSLDLSRARIVRDTRWEALQRVIRALVYQRVFETQTSSRRDSTPPFEPSRELELLTSAFADRREEESGDLARWAGELITLFLATPVFYSASKKSKSRWSLGDLHARLKREGGPLLFTRQRYAIEPKAANGAIADQGVISIDDLSDFLGVEAQSCDEALQDAMRMARERLQEAQRVKRASQEAREEFMRRPIRRDLPGDLNDPGLLAIDSPHGRGSWSADLSALHFDECRVLLFAQFRCLRERELEASNTYLAGLVLRLVSPTLEPNQRYSDFALSPDYARLLYAAYQELPALFLELARRLDGDSDMRARAPIPEMTPQILAWIRDSVEGTTRRTFRRIVPPALLGTYRSLPDAVPPSAAIRVSPQRRLPADLPELKGDAELVAERLGKSGALAEAMIFVDVLGHRWSLLTLAGGEVLYVSERTPVAVELARANPDLPVLYVSAREGRWLRWFFAGSAEHIETVHGQLNDLRVANPLRGDQEELPHTFSSPEGEGSWSLQRGRSDFRWYLYTSNRPMDEGVVPVDSVELGMLAGVSLRLNVDHDADWESASLHDGVCLELLEAAAGALPAFYENALLSMVSSRRRQLRPNVESMLRAWLNDDLLDVLGQALEVIELVFMSSLDAPRSRDAWQELREGSWGDQRHRGLDAYQLSPVMRIAELLTYDAVDGRIHALPELLPGVILCPSPAAAPDRDSLTSSHQSLPIVSIEGTSAEFVRWMLGPRAIAMTTVTTTGQLDRSTGTSPRDQPAPSRTRPLKAKAKRKKRHRSDDAGEPRASKAREDAADTEAVEAVQEAQAPKNVQIVEDMEDVQAVRQPVVGSSDPNPPAKSEERPTFLARTTVVDEPGCLEVERGEIRRIDRGHPLLVHILERPGDAAARRFLCSCVEGAKFLPESARKEAR